MYPDQNVAISPVTTASRFLTRVYGWMAAGLALTALVAGATASNPAFAKAIIGTPLFFVLIIGELGLVAWLSGLIGKMSAATASVVFLVYSAINGLTLSVVFFAYTRESIASTFVVTAAT